MILSCVTGHVSLRTAPPNDAEGFFDGGDGLRAAGGKRACASAYSASSKSSGPRAIADACCTMTVVGRILRHLGLPHAVPTPRVGRAPPLPWEADALPEGVDVD